MKVQLKDAYKKYTLDQDKIMSPEETVGHFREKLASVDLDILEDVIRIDNGRLDIPVYFSTCGRDALQIIGTKKQMGKGATPRQAEASAVMELAERFSFFSFAKNPDNFTMGTWRDIGPEAIPFDLIAASVHEDPDAAGPSREIFQDLPMQWARGYNLTRERDVRVPFDWFFAINEFNGPSAGNCPEEALSQGICEIVERHVSSLVSRNRKVVPQIDPTSVTDPVVSGMIGKYRHAGIELILSDFTLGMGIPSVGALAYDPSTFPSKSEIVWTAGTTPSPLKALSRAMTEVAQLGGDFNTSANYVASGLPKFTDLREADFVIRPTSLFAVTDLPDISDDNIRVEVNNLINALADRGMEVIVLDTTHPQLQIPAFYTIVPGAHFRERAEGTSVAMFTAKLAVENLPTEQALRELERIDSTIPGKYYIKFYQAMCRMATGELSTALDLLTQSLDLDPKAEDIPSIYSYMGVCLKDMGRFRDALEALSKGLTYDPDRTDIYNIMGFCHFKLKEHTDAIACFRKVLKRNPSSAIDYANIASNYRDMGETQKAIDHYEMALALDPGIEFARDNLNQLTQNPRKDS
ncbi:TPR domain protein [Olavius algarvensis associated proteobacterium Delta 3]|nr:TPR domain protein [Olavius algarvensis associated proteobacterium Delta 3]